MHPPIVSGRWVFVSSASVMLLTVCVCIATASSSLPPSPDGAIVLVAWSRPIDNAFYRVGSAFHVGNGRFYTAAHVARPSPPYPTDFHHINLLGTSWERQYGPAAVACVDARWRDAATGETVSPFDVALLRVVTAPNLPALSFSEKPPTEGMLVKIVGFPEASRSRPPRQYVAMGRIDRVGAEDFRIRILSGVALNGSSGSPVLTETGKVLGMIYAGHASKAKATDEYEWAVRLNVITSACP